MKADVSITEDGICINFPNVLITLDDEGLGYAILEGGSFRAGKFNTWPEIGTEINAALATISK